MSGDLVAAALLAAPGLLFGAVTLTGHAVARRRDATLAAVAAAPRGGPRPPGDPHPRPEHDAEAGPLAVVIDLDKRRRTPAHTPNHTRKETA
ncbi:MULTISPECIES: hypothetical protein [unclassified Streptomyces]|uniref:hypothetical protein n=1 Tax=unclassified Streptomyces TaxID=2593676 RepID=UPI0033E2C856